ncbi:TetR family transcriptional regulator [Burkholderia contaminans FFH2055]|uniref:TetR/AcrR family transcriptional regulator n=1 Tax=Burkholderia contaminans TaxID=488447 RepID=UPI000626D87A|nr:TetR/AcrR family transcriptional regulator [Burkholderia contaminans]KKL30667.1 TetR family transcriptional regulator [Burkholderia contaminans FFH2055]MEB4631989.1 TetR/AcrR family transcriptional regulator [Burkholderia contaminans]MEB4637574.1 TetR/AcrR family transcriptional regulator [Burkholderia contaminans]MEB4652658.1 TetR/AcrR family transcriptional regulator [Burkholderia contaminans]MEB4661094.1 TetR/AcrR family transcriptional regulator [Burkholderia contaminans]
MARPRSPDKHEAILAAAARALAADGASATTARIARLAGVAEGTVFTYFETKDALLNALYVSLKADMRDAMMTGFPEHAPAEQAVRHAWNGYVSWGVANPDGRRALRQLGVSGRIDDAHRAAGAEGFGGIGALLREQVAATGGLNHDEAHAFCSALFTSIAETAMESISRDPARADAYREAGFRALWAVLHAV